jgi:hypothetical protein
MGVLCLVALCVHHTTIYQVTCYILNAGAGVDPTPDPVEFVVEKLALEQLSALPVSIIPPMLHSNLSVSDDGPIQICVLQAVDKLSLNK